MMLRTMLADHTTESRTIANVITGILIIGRVFMATIAVGDTCAKVGARIIIR
jgi:hypothetical protein